MTIRRGGARAFRHMFVFGLLGAAAALAVAALTEPVAARLQDRFIESPALIFRGDLARRLELAGGHSGEVQVTLTWNNINDVDLHVVDPSGEHIYWRQRQSRSGGNLDVDMNVHPESTTPVENVYWPFGQAPQGRYLVLVHEYRNHGAPDPTPYRCRICVRGHATVFAGTVSHGKGPVRVFSFVVGPPKARWDSRWAGFCGAVMVVAAWSALLAAALAAVLIVAEERVLGHAVIPRGALPGATGGGAARGALAGIPGQALFALLSLWQHTGAAGSTSGRFLGLVLAGAVLARTLSYVIPFMLRRAALQVGAAGGALAALAFYYAPIVQQRLWVAAVLGAAVGILIRLPGSTARVDGWHAPSAGQADGAGKGGQAGRGVVQSPPAPGTPGAGPAGRHAGGTNGIRTRTASSPRTASPRTLSERQGAGGSMVRARSLDRVDLS